MPRQFGTRTVHGKHNVTTNVAGRRQAADWTAAAHHTCATNIQIAPQNPPDSYDWKLMTASRLATEDSTTTAHTHKHALRSVMELAGRVEGRTSATSAAQSLEQKAVSQEAGDSGSDCVGRMDLGADRQTDRQTDGQRHRQMDEQALGGEGQGRRAADLWICRVML